jgi:nucleoside-diphosphate-sugar epimerase
MADMEGRILVTGAVGQIGSELTLALRGKYGGANVVAAGHITEPRATLRDGGPFIALDVRNRAEVEAVVDTYEIATIYHMAAILSAVGEQDPRAAWDVNITGLLNILEVARTRGVSRVFLPSSMAVYGPDAPRDLAPQAAALNPTTMYGITKVVGEALAKNYIRKYGLDVRGLRYPGVISADTPPGGGTTDYAVEIFYAAEASGHYSCFVREDTVLPMMYMPDCFRATLELMEAPFDALEFPAGYNVAGMSFSAGRLAKELQRHLPGFSCSYVPDSRQAIADSWPLYLDDAAARRDWKWMPRFGLEEMVADMLVRLS